MAAKCWEQCSFRRGVGNHKIVESLQIRNRFMLHNIEFAHYIFFLIQLDMSIIFQKSKNTVIRKRKVSPNKVKTSDSLPKSIFSRLSFVKYGGYFFLFSFLQYKLHIAYLYLLYYTTKAIPRGTKDCDCPMVYVKQKD